MKNNHCKKSALGTTRVNLLSPLAATVVSILLSAVSITTANAAIIIDIKDDGDGIIATVTGSFNYGTFSGFTNAGTNAEAIIGYKSLNIYHYSLSNDFWGIGSSAGTIDSSNWSGNFFTSGPAVQVLTPLSSKSGEATGGWKIYNGGLLIPENYVSGTEWVSSARFDGTLTSRPTSGSYVTWTMTETGDTVTMRYNSSSIPEPSSLALLALGAGGLTMRRRRKAQAV